jgi:FkbM family methyltransferase
MANPGKMLYPKFAKLTGRSIEKKSRTFWGGEMNVILPEAVSTHIWRYGYFEAEVCSYFINMIRKGMTLIDIGGHFGFFTLLGGYLVGESGKVLVFEPTPNTYSQLHKNISEYSMFPNIEAINCAAYSRNTSIVFHDRGLEYSAFNSAASSRKPGDVPDNDNEIFVEARKVDDVLKEKGINSVDFIKIDAESSEIEVLEGMTETLKICRPAIVVEVGDIASDGVPRSEEVVALLNRMNYSAYETRRGDIVPHTPRKHYDYANLLFVAD